MNTPPRLPHSSRLIPLTEHGWDVPDEPSEREAVSALSSSTYSRLLDEVLALHTGSKETYLQADQEQELAAHIASGREAQAELLASPKRRDRNKKQQQIDSGKEAEQKLLECNLKLSSYLARASMNILPRGDNEATDPDSKAYKRRRALLNSRQRWNPADLTSLRSRHAELDDRIQVANMALLKAVQSFTPGLRGDNGNIVPFISYAAPVIKTALSKHAQDQEKPIRLPSYVMENIRKARRDSWEDHFTEDKREELLGYEQLQETHPFDDFYFVNAAEEETERPEDDSPLLWAGEVISSEFTVDPLSEAVKVDSTRMIEHLLASLSEREAGVIRLRYGLLDGESRSLDEVGRVYGVTRERVRQIEQKVLAKIRRSDREYDLATLLEPESSPLPMRSGDVVKTQRTMGRSSMQLFIIVPEEPDTSGKESWQAYPDEEWDAPVRKTTQELASASELTGEQFKQFVFALPARYFEKTQINEPYPLQAITTTLEKFKQELTIQQIADFWNSHLEELYSHFTNVLQDSFNPDKVTRYMSRLIAEQIKDGDEIELRIPKSLDGTLNYVGAWLSHGIVTVKGNLGNRAGFEIAGLSRLKVVGSAEDFAGDHMSGYARLEIEGDAADFAGSGMTGGTRISIKGNVGNYCGHRMNSSEAIIEVGGSAGRQLGFNARGGEITVGQNKARPLKHT